MMKGPVSVVIRNPPVMAAMRSSLRATSQSLLNPCPRDY